MTTNPRCSAHKDRQELPRGCAICNRIALEADIVTRTVDALLAKGYRLGLVDGDGARMDPTTDRAKLLVELMEVDDEWLTAFGNDSEAGGWVRFVYGNDGYDVISDYTVNLEDALKPVNDYADQMAG